MRTHPHFESVSLDQHMRRARRLRSREAITLFGDLAAHIGAVIMRAFVRPYRMTPTTGCRGEA